MINFDAENDPNLHVEHHGANRERLTTIYAGMINSIGLTGREIARISGTRPQYISDIKRRQRPLS